MWEIHLTVDVTVTVTIWIVATLPLWASFAVFVLGKTGVAKAPLPDDDVGTLAKIVSLLTAAGRVGLRAMPAGLGGGLVLAVVWGGVSLMVEGTHLFRDHVLTLVLSTPAVTVIFCTATMAYRGWRAVASRGEEDSVPKTNVIPPK